jgi:hypothetical protein
MGAPLYTIRRMRGRQLGSWLLTLFLPAFLIAAEKPVGPYGVPDDDAVVKATKLIKQTFAQDYVAATTLPQRATLAKRLLKEAVDTRDDTPARYALLCEARDLAAKSADAPTACRAIELLSQTYGVASGEMTVAALSNVSRVALTLPSQEALAHSAIAAADQALSRDDYDVAARLAALGEAAAIKTQKIVLLTDAQEKRREITWASQEYARAKSAMEVLTTRPDDADAKAAAGRFKCLVKNDWEHGLPLLLEGADAQFKALAERDQAAITAGAAMQYEIAEQWWTLGDQYLQRARLACRGRAAHWYKLAGPKLTGLPRTLAEKRLEEIDLMRLREMHLEPGLGGEVFEGQQFDKFLTVRIDPQLNLEWPAGKREDLPKENFSIRWTGHLRAPATGKYVLMLHVNDGAKIYLDDKMILEELKGSRKTKAAQTTLTLTEGPHPMRVEFWDSGGQAKIRLLWQPPGAKTEEIIPAKAFVHEIGTGH